MPSELVHIVIEDDERVLAGATMRVELTALYASLHVEAGHLPVGTRARLVDAVLDEPRAEAATAVHVTLPAGDGEILARLRERCADIETRAAGCTCLATGALPRPAQP